RAAGPPAARRRRFGPRRRRRNRPVDSAAFWPSLEGNHLARPHRLVDGSDEGDRLATFAAVHLRGTIGLDRPNEVGELAGVTLVRDRLRVPRPARRADLLGEPLLYREVSRGFGREIPAQDVFLLDDGRAAIAVDGDGLRQAGMNARRRL